MCIRDSLCRHGVPRVLVPVLGDAPVWDPGAAPAVPPSDLVLLTAIGAPPAGSLRCREFPLLAVARRCLALARLRFSAPV
eukprot:8671589-Alexandrium_andersonii.AAC.1